MPHELSEQEKIAQYQRGWDDAMMERKNASQARLETTHYYIGFVEARAGTPHRFTNYEGA